MNESPPKDAETAWFDKNVLHGNDNRIIYLHLDIIIVKCMLIYIILL